MNLLLAEINPVVLFIAGLMLVVGVVLRWTRRRMRRRPADALFTSGSHGAAGDHRLSPPASLALWEVNMHEVARDLSGQLDTKIRIVQQLVLRAEQQSARLEALLNRAELTLEHQLAARSGGAVREETARADS